MDAHEDVPVAMSKFSDGLDASKYKRNAGVEVSDELTANTVLSPWVKVFTYNHVANDTRAGRGAGVEVGDVAVANAVDDMIVVLFEYMYLYNMYATSSPTIMSNVSVNKFICICITDILSRKLWIYIF